MRSRNRSRTGHFFESAEGGLGFDLQAAERERQVYSLASSG